MKPPLFSLLYPNICILSSTLSAVVQLPEPHSTHFTGPRAKSEINPAENLVLEGVLAVQR